MRTLVESRRTHLTGRSSMAGSEGVIVARRALHDEDEEWEERLFDAPDDDEDEDFGDDDDLDEDADVDLEDDEDDVDLDDLDEDV
jgi:hypothetical protein